MIMMHNDDVKKNLGCSPDEGLAYVYGIYGLKLVPDEIIPEFPRRVRKRPMQFA